MTKAQAQSQLPSLMTSYRPTLPMPPTLLTSSPEIEEIVSQSSSEQELLANLVSFAVDLISEDDFADFSTTAAINNKNKNNKSSRNNYNSSPRGDGKDRQ